MEDSKAIPINAYYILVYGKNDLIAFAMAYVQTDDLYNTLGKAILGKFEKFSPAKLNPCLLCYSPMSVTGFGIEISPDYEKETATITGLVLKKMEEIAKTEKLKFYGFLNLSDTEKTIDSVLTQNGFNRCFTCFDTYADSDYKSLDKYLKSMKSEKRRRMKQENNRCESFNIKTHISSEIDIAEFFPMIETIQKHHNTKVTTKKLWDFLPCLQKNLKENFVIFFDTKNGENISMVACVKFKDLITLLKSGNRDSQDDETTLSYYAINHIEAIKYAINNGLKKVGFGTGSYPAKILRMAKPKPLYLHLKGTSKLLRFYLKIIFPIIDYVKYKRHIQKMMPKNIFNKTKYYKSLNLTR